MTPRADNYWDQIASMLHEHIHEVRKAGGEPDKLDEWLWLQTSMTCRVLEQLETLNAKLDTLITVSNQVRANTAPE